MEKQQIVNTVGDEYNQGVVQTFNERYEGVKGSPFLYDQWIRGRITVRNGHTFENLKVKYDLYHDEIRVKRQDGAIVIPEKSSVQWFTLDSTTTRVRRFVRVDYLENYRKFPYNHFAEVLYEGKSTLLALYNKSLIRADYRGAYNANRPYDKFSEVAISYYLIAPNGKVSLLKPNVKYLRRLLKNKDEKVDELLTNGTFEKPQDLVQLITLYDQ